MALLALCSRAPTKKGPKIQERWLCQFDNPQGASDVVRYHAYIVPIQKGLRKFRRFATFWCYLTGGEQRGWDVRTSDDDERSWVVTVVIVVGWGEMSDILLGNVLENHIYEE